MFHRVGLEGSGQDPGLGLKSAYSGAHPLCRPILDIETNLRFFSTRREANKLQHPGYYFPFKTREFGLYAG
jgi:hypothetical protein